MKKVMLAFEVPTPELWRFAGVQDLDFYLIHRLGGDRAYRSYALRPSSRPAIIDNSLIELSTSWQCQEICNLLHTLYYDGLDFRALPENFSVVAPDFLFDGARTRTAFLHAKAFRSDMSWCYIVHGQDAEERAKELAWAHDQGIPLIGFGLKEARLDWLQKMPLVENQRYHMYGLAHPKELELATHLPGIWSADTGKPFKMALAGIKDWDKARGLKIQIDRQFLSLAQTQLADQLIEQLRSAAGHD